MSKMFSTPAIPTPEAPAPVPVEADAKKARQRAASGKSRASGQESTLLSTGGRETLGA